MNAHTCIRFRCMRMRDHITYESLKRCLKRNVKNRKYSEFINQNVHFMCVPVLLCIPFRRLLFLLLFTHACHVVKLAFSCFISEFECVFVSFQNKLSHGDVFDLNFIKIRVCDMNWDWFSVSHIFLAMAVCSGFYGGCITIRFMGQFSSTSLLFVMHNIRLSRYHTHSLALDHLVMDEQNAPMRWTYFFPSLALLVCAFFGGIVSNLHEEKATHKKWERFSLISFRHITVIVLFLL